MAMAVPMQALPQQLQMGAGVGALAPLNNVFAKQTRRGCFQEIMGCEAKTEFKIATIENKQMDIMYGLEESDFCIRLCCNDMRPWTFNLNAGGGPGGPPIARFTRDLRCLPAPCKCCCYQQVSAFDASGQPLGGAEEVFFWFVPKFEVRRPDNSVEYVLTQPTCVGGMCVDIFAEGLCNCRIPWYIFAPGSGENKGSEIGKMVKVWSGLGTELFSDADKFEVQFPPGAPPDSKARIMGALFLINQLYFEGE